MTLFYYEEWNKIMEVLDAMSSRQILVFYLLKYTIRKMKVETDLKGEKSEREHPLLNHGYACGK
jgi:hypothetical protein